MADFHCLEARPFLEPGVSGLGEIPILTLIFELEGEDLSFVTVTQSLAVSPSWTGNVLGGKNTFSPSAVNRRHEGGTVICILLILRARGCLRFSRFATALGSVSNWPFFDDWLTSTPLEFGLDFGEGAAVSLGGGCETGDTLGSGVIFTGGKLGSIKAGRCKGLKIGRLGRAVNADEGGPITGVLVVTVTWGPCPLNAKRACDPLKVFSNTGMGVEESPTDLLSSIDFREPKVVSLTSFFPLAWLYSSTSIGSCLTATTEVVTTLVVTGSGATTPEALGSLTTPLWEGDTTVALMDLPFGRCMVKGISFILFAGLGFCSLIDGDPVTHLCQNWPRTFIQCNTIQREKIHAKDHNKWMLLLLTKQTKSSVSGLVLTHSGWKRQRQMIHWREGGIMPLPGQFKLHSSSKDCTLKQTL